jgi:hypothetical protein
VQDRGLRFGVIYNSDWGFRISDKRFFDETMHFWDYHNKTGDLPNDIIVQSWYWYPRSWLPVDDPSTYTNLLINILRSENLTSQFIAD